MSQPPQTLRIGPFNVQSFSAPALLAEIHRRMALGRHCALFFANTNFVVSCASFAPRFASCSAAARPMPLDAPVITTT